VAAPAARPPITSTRNPRVRAAAALARGRERRSQGRHLVEGPRAVGEALAAGVVVEVLTTPDRGVDLVVPDGVALTLVADHVLDHIADTASPQGIVAVAHTRPASLEDALTGDLVLVLDGVADPGNVGTTVRTGDAAGADGLVVIAGSADPFGPKAIRAAVGSTYHLPLAVDVQLADVLAACRSGGRRTLGLDASARRSVFDLAPDDAPLALILGSEAHGLSAPDALDGLLAVPIAPRAESLNVATAAAVAAFTASRALRGGRNR
jgi:TrmH family RNA methyltransferase